MEMTETLDSSVPRRQFLIRAGALIGIGLVAGSMPGLITSCSNSTGPNNDNHGPKTVDVTQYTELQNDYGAVKVPFTGYNGNMPAIIIREAAGTYLVLTSLCSHQGCEVNLPDSAAKTISCPCHGSKYSEVDGSVINGPTTRALQVIPSSFNASNNILTITF
jgi:Rieske Fe-S protein